MKRIIALILVLSMCIGLIVSVSATNPFEQRLNLARLIKMMFGADDEAPEFGELDGGILTVYVAPSGKENASGTENAPFGSVTAARDAIRTLDKSKFDGITVLIKEGIYTIAEPIVFTAEDSGTEDCPITYCGEEGANIVGGVALTAKDFSKATGNAVQYFPEDVKDNIVQVDLTSLGFTVEQVNSWTTQRNYRKFISFLSVNGQRQTIARFPNDTWANVDGGTGYGYDDEVMPLVDLNSRTHYYIIEYGEEYFDRVSSWTSENTKFVRARWRFLWFPDDSYIMDISKETDTMKVRYSWGAEVREGAIFYWYNVPEELDVPGEYYIDEDAVLYYYPKEGFDTASVSLPLSKNIFTIEDADHITLMNLNMTSSLNDGIYAKNVNNLSIIDCELSSTAVNGIKMEGINCNITIQGNHIYDIGDNAIKADFGDFETMTSGNTRVYNNYIHDWGINGSYCDGYAITVSGLDILVDHNVCHTGEFKGIHIGTGVNVTVEYNEVYDVCRLSEDVGAFSGDGGKYNGNIVFRYNYAHDIGPLGLPTEEEAGKYAFPYAGAVAFYYDGASSYYNTYGNVAAHIDGDGILSNAGRHNYITGNLIVDCTSTYVNASEYGYGNNFDENGKYSKRRTSLSAYVYSDEYKAINPEPSQLILSIDENTDPSEKLVIWTPAFIKVQNNWCHYNKANRDYTNWGVVPYNIEKYVWIYSNEGEIDSTPNSIHGTNDNVSVYSSKREEVDLEKLIKETATGVIEITWEQFCDIGIVLEDWNHDVEIPEKVTHYGKW